MPSSEPLKLGSTTTDIVASLLRGTTGMVPVVGSMIAEIVGNTIPNQRVERIVAYALKLSQELENVRVELIKTRMTQPEFLDILEDSFFQAARAISEERLEHIANVVANGLSADQENAAETKRMLWLLGQLNDAEVILIRGMLPKTNEEIELDHSFLHRHTALLQPPQLDMNATNQQIADSEIRKSYLRHVGALGLSHSETIISVLGMMLMEYSKLLPDWWLASRKRLKE